MILASDTRNRMCFFVAAMLVLSSYVARSFGQVLNPASEPWKKWRNLPTDVEPLRYDLNITPKCYTNNSYFDGYALIHMKVNSRTNLIVVQSKRLQILSWKVLDEANREIERIRFYQYKPNDYLVFRAPRSLPRQVKLQLHFRGNITTLESRSTTRPGLNKIPYVNRLNGKQSWLLVTDFHPNNARFVFPTFDEPHFKVKFNITIRHKKDYTALSNTPVQSQRNCSGGWQETTFKLSPRMCSHLVSFTISKFGFKSKIVNETEIRVWSRPDRLNEVDYALNVTATLLQYLSKELGKPSSLEKLDQFAVPRDLVLEKSEQWGLAVYHESRLLFNATEEVNESSKDEALRLIVRTLVYSYFGNLSTSLSHTRNHLWLKEGLLKCFEVRTLMLADPTFFHRHLDDGREMALLHDGTGGSKALVPMTDSPIREDKGAELLRMVEGFVGVNAFNRAVARFLHNYSDDSIVANHLWNEIQQEVGDSPDIKKAMTPWVYEAGFPVIKVELFPENVINATQKQFLPYSEIHRSNTKKWYVPLSYRTKSESHGLVWMNKTDAVFHIPLNSSDDWIQLNFDGTGYYRVNYDTNLWQRITKQLSENHTVFTESSRSTLLSDAGRLAIEQQLDFDTFLNLTKYASKETEFSPWLCIADTFDKIRLELFHTSIASRFESYILNLTSKLMDEFLLNDTESHIENLKVRQLRWKLMSLSCAAGHKGCIEVWTRAFKVWIENETHVVAEDSRREVYCVAMANSVDESDWKTVFERYTIAGSDDERIELLHVLCCTRNVTVLEWLLDLYIQHVDEENPDDLALPQIMLGVSENPSTGGLLWNWFKRNFEEIDHLYGPETSDFAIVQAAADFRTQAQYQELLDFYTDEAYDIEANDLNNRIESHARWNERNFIVIANWLEEDGQR